MANREQEIGKIKYIIDKMRQITFAVQIAPFIYTAIYIICMILYPSVSERLRWTLDTLFYVSPTIVMVFLLQSRILKLCKWHRIACLLPILPQILVFVDYHIIELTDAESYIGIAVPIVISSLFLIAAYKVFFANGR